jgi:hypothetical protein
MRFEPKSIPSARIPEDLVTALTGKWREFLTRRFQGLVNLGYIFAASSCHITFAATATTDDLGTRFDDLTC